MNIDKTAVPQSGDTWDLSPLAEYANEAALQLDQTAARATAEAFAEKWGGRFSELSNSAILAEALNEYELWHVHYGLTHDIVGDSGIYWKLRSMQDSGDQLVQSKLTGIRANAQYIEHLLCPFELAIGQISPKSQEQLLAAPELSRYASFLERLFQTAIGRLNADTEAELEASWQSVRYNHILPLANALSTTTPFTHLPAGRTGPQTVTSLVNLMSDPDQALRDSAAAAFNSLLVRLSGQAAEEMSALTSHWRYENKLRRFRRPDQKRLVQDRLPGEVIDSLLTTVSGRYDLSHRFYRVMAATRGVSQIKYHERYIRMGKPRQTYTWPEARHLIETTYAAVDPQFGHIVRQMGEQGLIDVYPRAGKSTIEKCDYFKPALPPFVSLLFAGSPLDVVVSGHELAHMLHAELMKPPRIILDYGTPAWMIELPAMFFERYFWDRLIQAADLETRFALLAERCSRFIAMVFRQVAGYQFEQQLHSEAWRHEPREIGGLFQREMAAYMGPAVEQSIFSHNWWIHWPHLRTPFYNSAYPLGMLISSAMHARLAADSVYLERIKDFLAIGLSAPFSRVLEGLDLKVEGLWTTGLTEIETLLNELEALGQTLGYLESRVLATA